MKITQSERTEQWSQGFLDRLQPLLKFESETVPVKLGRVKNSKHQQEYDLLKSQLVDITNYVDFLVGRGVVKTITATYHANLLIHVGDYLKKPFKEYIENDLRKLFLNLKKEGYSESYIQSHKMIVKSFFRWLYGFKKEDNKYPEVVAWIYAGRKKNSVKLPTILTKEEVTKMLNACDNLRDRAIIHLLFDSGCRKGELLHMRIKDLVFDEYSGYVIVSGKTGSRRIRLISSIPDLKAWLNVHPYSSNPEAPMFIALGKNTDGFICDSVVQWVVKKTAKRAKLGRNIYPHLFRHTNATYWSRFLKEPQMRIRFGWTATSNMPAIYVHLSGEDVDAAVLEAAGLMKPGENHKPIPKIPPKFCLKCHDENPIANKFCQSCGFQLDEETLLLAEEIQSVLKETTSKILQRMKTGAVGEKEKEEIVAEWAKEKMKNKP